LNEGRFYFPLFRSMNLIITQAAYYSVIYPAILPVTPRPFA